MAFIADAPPGGRTPTGPPPRGTCESTAAPEPDALQLLEPVALPEPVGASVPTPTGPLPRESPAPPRREAVAPAAARAQGDGEFEPPFPFTAEKNLLFASELPFPFTEDGSALGDGSEGGGRAPDGTLPFGICESTDAPEFDPLEPAAFPPTGICESTAPLQGVVPRGDGRVVGGGRPPAGTLPRGICESTAAPSPALVELLELMEFAALPPVCAPSGRIPPAPPPLGTCESTA